MITPLDRIRAEDNDRFFCALFAPAPLREALFALLAFNLEIAAAGARSDEPLIGQIRLQFWRDRLQDIYGENEQGPSGHPVARALSAHKDRLTSQHLEAMIEARERDMQTNPFSGIADLEAYAAATSGRLAEVSVALLEPAAKPVALRIGAAWALIGLVRARGHRRSHDLSDGLAAQALIRARELLGEARAMRGQTSRASLPVLLAAVLAEGYLNDLKRSKADPNHPLTARPAGLIRRLSVIVHAALGRY